MSKYALSSLSLKNLLPKRLYETIIMQEKDLKIKFLDLFLMLCFAFMCVCASPLCPVSWRPEEDRCQSLWTWS